MNFCLTLPPWLTPHASSLPPFLLHASPLVFQLTHLPLTIFSSTLLLSCTYLDLSAHSALVDTLPLKAPRMLLGTLKCPSAHKHRHLTRCGATQYLCADWWHGWIKRITSIIEDTLVGRHKILNNVLVKICKILTITTINMNPAIRSKGKSPEKKIKNLRFN